MCASIRTLGRARGNRFNARLERSLDRSAPLQRVPARAFHLQCAELCRVFSAPLSALVSALFSSLFFWFLPRLCFRLRLPSVSRLGSRLCLASLRMQYALFMKNDINIKY